MARLLRNKDYSRHIQNDNLLQIIESDYNLMYEVEQSAQSEMISYLVQRYKTDRIFSDTSVFDISATYYGKSLVEYTEATFSAATAYSTGNRVVYNGNIYESIAGSAAHAFSANEWTLITEDKSLYYGKLPYSEYNNSITYSAGNQVWYEDYVYTCIAETTGNIPTDTNYWTVGSQYTFTGQLPDNTTYWIKGDNRNQQILMYLIDITLYHLHSRINPRNIPEVRMIRYDGNNALQTGGAIGWLKRVASGDITADLQQILPEQGLSIRYGSNTKNINTY